MENLFEKLSPPPGGLEGLRRKLETRGSGSFHRGLIPVRLAGATTITILVLAVVAYRLLSPEQMSGPEYGIFQRYMEAPPNEAVSLLPTESTGLRLVQQPTGNAGITLYWIEEEDG